MRFRGHSSDQIEVDRPISAKAVIQLIRSALLRQSFFALRSPALVFASVDCARSVRK